MGAVASLCLRYNPRLHVALTMPSDVSVTLLIRINIGAFSVYSSRSPAQLCEVLSCAPAPWAYSTREAPLAGHSLYDYRTACIYENADADEGSC